MEYLGYWLATVIASFIGEIANDLRVFKDAASAGYKINLNQTTEGKNQIFSSYTNFMFFKMLLPLINIIEVYKNIIVYNNNKEMLIEQLYAQDKLEVMSTNERAEWLKKPTALNAIIVPIRYKRRLEQATTIKMVSDEKSWEMTFELGDELLNKANKDDITIFEARGAAYGMSDDERRKEILNILASLSFSGDSKNFMMLLLILKGGSNTFVVNLGKEEQQEEDNERDNSTRGKIDELKTIQDELMNESSLEEQEKESDEQQISGWQKTLNSKKIGSHYGTRKKR